MVLFQRKIKVTAQKVDKGNFKELVLDSNHLYFKTTENFECNISGADFADFIAQLYKTIIDLYEGENYH